MTSNYTLTQPTAGELPDGTIRLELPNRYILIHATRPTGNPDSTSWTITYWQLPIPADVILDPHTPNTFEDRQLILHVLEATEPPTGTLTWTPDATLPALHTPLTDRENYQLSSQLDKLATQLLDDAILEPLYTRIPKPHLQINDYGGVVPFQAYGTWYGYAFYFRYRGGHASLRVGDTEDTVISQPLWEADVYYGDELQGALDRDEFITLFCDLGSNLKRANFSYRFRYTGTPDGTSPAYVFRTAESPAEAAAQVDNTYALEPPYEDPRIFPEHTPAFLVLPAADPTTPEGAAG